MVDPAKSALGRRDSEATRGGGALEGGQRAQRPLGLAFHGRARSLEAKLRPLGPEVPSNTQRPRGELRPLLGWQGHLSQEGVQPLNRNGLALGELGDVAGR
eukprot:4063613-Alexandrium_andersonii.AAC.1